MPNPEPINVDDLSVRIVSQIIREFRLPSTLGIASDMQTIIANTIRPHILLRPPIKVTRTDLPRSD